MFCFRRDASWRWRSRGFLVGGGGRGGGGGGATPLRKRQQQQQLFLKGGSQHMSKINALRAQHARSTQQHLQDFVQSQIPTVTVWFPNSVQVRTRPSFYLASGEYIVSFSNNLAFRETFSSTTTSENSSSHVGQTKSSSSTAAAAAASSPSLNPDSVTHESGKDPYSQLFPKTIDIALAGADR